MVFKTGTIAQAEAMNDDDAAGGGGLSDRYSLQGLFLAVTYFGALASAISKTQYYKLLEHFHCHV
jgi:hypothetical protein